MFAKLPYVESRNSASVEPCNEKKYMTTGITFLNSQKIYKITVLYDVHGSVSVVLITIKLMLPHFTNLTTMV